MNGFVFLNVFHHCLHETLGMLWGEYYAGFDFCFRQTRHHINKIYHEFGVGMRYDSEISVLTFCHFFTQFDVELMLFFLLIFHVFTV